MKGYFSQRTTRPPYNFTRRVSSVLVYLKTLFPLHELTLLYIKISFSALFI